VVKIEGIARGLNNTGFNPQRDTNPFVLWNSAGLYALPNSPGSVFTDRWSEVQIGGRLALTATAHLDLCFVVVV